MEGSGDTLLRAISNDGTVAVRALLATALVAEAAERHHTSPLATAALGRSLMGALLLGSAGKDGENVQLRLRGDGPLRTVVAIADADGRARGYVSKPDVSLPTRGGQPDVARAIGLGGLSVVRHGPRWRQPYTGVVPLVSGEIAQDLALYLTESEQTPSAVALGVYVERDGSVACAGGYLAQALPGADDAVLARLEENVRDLAPPSELLRQGGDAESMVHGLLEGIGGLVLERHSPIFHCGCNRERVLRAVALLGRADLDEAVAEGEPLEVTCEFCAERYEVDPDHARALLPDA
jgi:molecular chaperone Hsp33